MVIEKEFTVALVISLLKSVKILQDCLHKKVRLFVSTILT
jgi:hypothetical protein